MKNLMKSIICVAILSACGVEHDGARVPSAPVLHGPTAQGGHEKDLIRVNLGACGDSNGNGGLIHVDLGGNRCCYGWGCGYGRR